MYKIGKRKTLSLLRRLIRPNGSNIELYWHRDNEVIGTPLNFGDELSPLIVEYVSGIKTRRASIELCELVSLGSILISAIIESQVRTEKNPLYVWGSGHIFDHKPEYDNLHYYKNILRIYAVRGSLTASRLGVYEGLGLGDPALLVADFIRKQKGKKTIGVIPHYVDKKDKRLNIISKKFNDLLIIDVHNNPVEVVKQISSCSLILSSSLHGIICADSYNIPAYWMPLSNNVAGDGYKFRDYFSLYDIAPPVVDINDIILKGTKYTNSLIKNHKKRKGIEAIKDRLFYSFPRELMK